MTRCVGVFPDPVKLAYHDVGLPHLPLYTVAFEAGEVWGRADPGVTIAADLYQPWLERDDPGPGSPQGPHAEPPSAPT